MSQNNPFADLMDAMNKTMSQMTNFQLPGLNMASLQEASQANIDAINEANKIAMEGMQSLASRSQEMANDAMKDLQASAQSLTDAKDGSLAKPAEMARANFEKAVSNLRELTEIATKSQTEAWGVIGKRWQDTLMGGGKK